MRFLPESAARSDWVRLAAGTVNALVRAVTTAQSSISTLQTDLGTAETDITALDGRVTTAEADISALETATNWGALSDYADDTAAASGGVAVGALYRTGSIIKVRVS